MRALLLLLILLLGAAPTAEQSARIAELEARAAASEADGSPDGIVALSLLLRVHRQLGDPTAEAATLARLARHMRRAGRWTEAAEKLEEARALDKKQGNDAALAADLAELGATWAGLGDAKKAARLHREAAKAYQDLEQPRGAADALVHLALDQRALADLPAAEETLGKALSLYDALDDASGRGDALTNLASLQAASGRPEEAIASSRAAIDAFAAAGDDAGRGAALHNLGNLYARLGDLERAAALYRQARPLLSAREQQAADVALAQLLLEGGSNAQALTAAEDGLAARPGDPTLLWIAWQADPDDARRAAWLAAARASDAPESRGRARLEELRATTPGRPSQKALLALADESDAHPTLQRDALLLAAEHARAADLDPLPALRRAATLAEDARRAAATLDPTSARRLVRQQARTYEALVDALLAAGDSAGALLYAERLRQAELDSPAGPDPAAAELAALGAREAELLAARRAAQTRLDAGATDDRIATLDAELAALRMRFSERVDELRTLHPDFELLVTIDPADIESWQRDLAPDQVVLQPILLPDRLVLLVFSSGPLRAVDVPVDPGEVRTRVSRVLRTLRGRRTSNVERLNEHLDALGSWLWAPVADTLASHPRVAVVPAGPLRYLPFQLLRHEGRYLVEEHEVVNVTNVGSLKTRADDALALGEDDLLALGNPDGSLPAADAEVDALVALFPRAAVAHGERATRARIAVEAPRRSVLHLATHGVLDPERPERSYIVLAPDGEDDGRLGYLQIPGLYQALADTGLVVLSACETAVPVERPDGAEDGLEIAGLANQFRRAGVPRLLASLWQVSDTSTQALMVAFYEGLGQGRSPAEALTAAQRTLLAQPETAHPFHWAPFVLIGSPD